MHDIRLIPQGEFMKICKVDGCNKEAKKGGYCETHYAQKKYYGGIKHLRTVTNEYQVIGDAVYITLYDKFHNPIPERTIIDKDDLHLIKGKRLSKSCTKTSTRIIVFDKLNGTQVKLHRLIMGNPKGKIVDHINRNQFDNRKCNLRICTQAENNLNKSSKGYYYHKQNKDYVVEIMKDGKKICKGGFSTEKEAQQKRIELEKEIFGEFAPIREAM
jgi:hypothetical protein